MNVRLSFAFALLGLLLATSHVFAQQNRGAQFPAAQRASELMGRMDQALKDVAASDEQHQKIGNAVHRRGSLMEETAAIIIGGMHAAS